MSRRGTLEMVEKDTRQKKSSRGFIKLTLLVRRANRWELLSNLVFEACRSCGDLVGGCGFNSVFERDAGDDFG